MTAEPIGASCDRCGRRNHAGETCDEVRAREGAVVHRLFQAARRPAAVEDDPAELLDAIRAHRDNLMRMLSASESKLDATEKERLDLLARVGYAEGAGEEGVRRWDLAEQRAKAAESRLDKIREAAGSLDTDPYSAQPSRSSIEAAELIQSMFVETPCADPYHGLKGRCPTCGKYKDQIPS